MKRKINIILVLSFFIINAYSQETLKSLSDAGQGEVEKGNYVEALAYYDRALELGSEDKSEMSWTALLASACADEMGDQKLVMKYYNVAIANGNTQIFIIDRQLELAKEFKDNETTEKVLLAAKEIEGQFGKYAGKLLYHYYNNKEYEKTISIADEFLSVNPGHTNTMYLKGMATLKSRGDEEALSLFEEILKQDPENSKTNMRVGFIYYDRAQNIYNEVNKAYADIFKPSAKQFDHYKKGVNRYVENYKISVEYLEKSKETRYQGKVQEAIKIAQERIDYWK